MRQLADTRDPSFVDLNRRFRKLEKKATAEEAALESYTSDAWGRVSTLGWEDVLTHSRVVILGEPGSGKTWELRECAKRLSLRKEFALFIRLDQLVGGNLRALLNADDQRRLAEWQQSSRVGYFFLDSVDEAKFRKISDFYTTLEGLRNEIGLERLSRARIYLSSRISEWRPSSDAFEFRRIFPQPPVKIPSKGGESRTKEDEPVPLVIHIEPLNRDQVEAFSRACQVSNASNFLQAIDKAFAWEFVRRPLDVVEIIAFWNEKGRIGSLAELIEFDVSAKLKPRAVRDEHPLSEADAREGAEWLAAATVFSRRFSFVVPDDGLTDVDSLNPLSCLPSNWRDDDVRALLNRAIFDSAVYGRFRFHHRRVGEYLASKWIVARMAGGCSPDELEAILAENVKGRKVLRSAMRAVAAWLCHGDERWNESVRSLVLETEPEIHLNFGDPGNLSLEYKRRILHSIARVSKGRRRLWIESSNDSLARLAEPGLSTDVAALISDSSLAVDLRREMLDIVRYGRLVACEAAALAVVESPEEPSELKTAAVRAIGAFESAESDRRLFQTISAFPSIPNPVCTSVVQALYPRSISIEELSWLLSKTQRSREFIVDLPYYLREHFKQVVTEGSACELLKALVVLVQTPPLTRPSGEAPAVSDQFFWLGQAMESVIAILLKKSNLSAEEAEVSGQALHLLGSIREQHHEYYHGDVKELSELATRHPAVRRCFLWAAVRAYRSEHKKEPTRSTDVFDHWSVPKFSSEDFSWLIVEIQAQAEGNNRLFALLLAIEAWDDSGRTFLNRRRLWRAVKRDPVLRATFRQSAVTRFAFPIKRFWWRNIQHSYGSMWWWNDKLRDIRNRFRWYRGQFLLLRKLRLIESGKPVKWLEILSREAEEKNSSHWAPSTWVDLEKKRGKRITRAARRGCAAMWRGFVPALPHQKEKANSTDIRVLVGLTGLSVEFEKAPSGMEKLTEGEAKLATRYAVEELNGFPPWLEMLAVFHPKAVAYVLSECIEGEWKFPIERQETHEVLSQIVWQGGLLLSLVQARVLSLLEESDPPNLEILQFALSILMRHSEPPAPALLKLAAARVQSADSIRSKVLWLAIWMSLDGEEAVTKLESMLQSLPDPTDIMVRLCSALSGEEGDRSPLSKEPSYLRPACLRRFIPLVYQQVKFSDDLDRSGGAYTPTARDHAERFRSTLLDLLAKDESPEATEVLRAMADDPALSHVRDWILNLLDQRLEREADFVPWTPSDLRDFAERHEVDPKNDKELFAITLKRLRVLKWDVEQSENSLRDELRTRDTEMVLRRWVQRKLLERSQARYTLPQECQFAGRAGQGVAGENRPLLR